MTQNLNDILNTIGGNITHDTLSSVAATLPEGFVLTLTVAGEVGVGGVFGLEGSFTDVYSPSGPVGRYYSGAGTAGTPSPLPFEFVGELGLAFVGDSGIESFEGFALSLEAGVVVGGGATVPLIGGIDYLENLVVASSSGDISAIIDALSDAPEGSQVFVSSGIQASAGAELSYTVISGNAQIPTFADSTLVLDTLNSLPSAGHPDNRTVNYVTAIDGTDHVLLQSVTKLGDALEVRTFVIDGNGNIQSGPEALAILDEYGIRHQGAFSGDVWARQFYASNGTPAAGTTVADFYSEIQECFGADTPVDMWPLDGSLKPGSDGVYDQEAVSANIWKKPIELIEVGDTVVSFDDKGNMVPGHVPYTFQNDAKILLNFHGTRVTPGHVYFRADSTKSRKFETLIDILRDDGVIEDRDRVKLRAATYAPVDGPLDSFVKAVTGARRPDGGVDTKEQGRIRLGTRFIVGEGKNRKYHVVADLIKSGNGTVGDDELIRVGDSEPMPFHWEFGDTLPKPEDYVLACSGTTLEDIYKAAEWEGQGPRLPAPMVLDRGPVQPLMKGAALSAMPRNEPLDVMHSPMTSAKPQRTLNRKQRKAMEAKQRKAAKSRKRVMG